MNRNLPPPIDQETLGRNENPPSYRASVQQQQSLDITQRFERKLAQYNASQNVLKRWLFEIISWITSAACMSAIIGILLYCRDEPLNQRSFALSAYNVLSKLASAALILPISEAIGQLKWTWFHGSESKDIYDFEIFDQASRGAWGSFLLLFRTKECSLAALGAVLTLLLLATDTFFQQVTDYPDRWALEEFRSTIASVVRYAPTYRPDYSQGWENQQYDSHTMRTVQQFLYGNGIYSVQSGNSTRPEVPLSCPATNCTWPVYDTLAICSQCVSIDVSSLLSYACMNTTINWSAHSIDPMVPDWHGEVCGYFVNVTSNRPTLMSGYVIENGTSLASSQGEALLVRSLTLTELYTKKGFYGTGSIHFNHLRNKILDILTVSASDGLQSVYSGEEPIVHECVLAWCVESIQSSYAWGDYKENVTGVFQNTTSGPWPWESFDIPDAGGGGSFVTYMENVTIEIPVSRTYSNVSARSFGASNLTAANMMAIFEDGFPSSYTIESSSTIPSLRYKNYQGGDGPHTRMLDFNPWLAPNNITVHMARLATAIANAMRSNTESITMVPGLAYNQKQFVVVRWEWLTFPFALLLLSLGFLVATVIKTSKNAQSDLGIWKTSAMPRRMYSRMSALSTPCRSK